MAVQPTYPGVYIQEVPSGQRSISGVATSIALFVGRTERGMMNKPTRVFNFTEFKDRFGEGTQESEMAHQVRQFFLNGGGQAYAMRIAKDAETASVELRDESGSSRVLKATAKEAGREGADIRIEVSYDTPQPEVTFNMRVFRAVDNGAGVIAEEDQERFDNLTMDPGSGRYGPDVVTQGSDLIELEDLNVPAGGPAPGTSPPQAGRLVSDRIMQVDGTDVDTRLSELISGSGGPAKNLLRVRLRGEVRELNLSGVAAVPELASELNSGLGSPAVTVDTATVTDSGDFNTGEALRISDSEGAVSALPASVPENDLGAALGLIAEQGGIEIGPYASRRPAPSGVFFHLDDTDFFDNLTTLAGQAQRQITSLTLTPPGGSGLTVSGLDLETTAPSDPLVWGRVVIDESAGSRRDGFFTNVHEKLLQLVDQFNDGGAGIPDLDWTAELHGLRLVLKPTAGGANAGNGVGITSSTFDIAGSLGIDNGRYYQLGPGGAGSFQTNGAAGTDGSVPGQAEYRKAFDVVSEEVDLFNLLVLPRDTEQTDEERRNLYSRASVFAQQQRAFLLVDPPQSWESRNDVISGTPTNIGTMRRGLVKDHAAMFWPRLTIVNPATGLSETIDPSGTIAGVAARIDARRGVWKAFAGIEADLRGVRAVEHPMSDAGNGVINQQAVNAIRTFPNGIISWGARTMDGFEGSGNIDYRYIPVRRLALFIEESLFRGLKWVVFEPNAEPLWAEIRKAAGGFMQDLFRQGAFKGTKPGDAYFVKVDNETTTQRDINLGIVNIWVGFAPVRPAEFVILHIQQIAGQGE